VGLRVVHQGARCIVLGHLTLIKNEHAIRLDYGVQSVSDRNHCRAAKLVIDQFLDFLLSNDVSICGCFVKDDHFAFAKDSPADAYELSFACAQVRTAFCYFSVDSAALERILPLVVIQAAKLDNFRLRSTFSPISALSLS